MGNSNDKGSNERELQSVLPSVDISELQTQEDILAQLDKNHWRQQREIKGAVTGPSGAGKSAFINSICQLSGDNKAEEGTRETTLVATEYSSGRGYTLVDLPGVGTENFPKSTYSRRFKLQQYDFFVILVLPQRRAEDDKLNRWLVSHISKDLKKPVFIVQSLIDELLIKEYSVQAHHRGFTKPVRDLTCDSDELRIIKDELFQRVKAQYLPDRLYVIGRPINPRTLAPYHEFEFEELTLAIADSLPPQQRALLVANFMAYSNEWIAIKEELLESEMRYFAAMSALGGAVPIPGASVAVDAGLVVKFALMCSEVFGMRVEDLSKRISPNVLKLFVPRIAALGAATTFVVCSASSVDDVLKAIPGVGAVVGTVVGAAVSGPAMYFALKGIRTVYANLLREILKKEATIKLEQEEIITLN